MSYGIFLIPILFLLNFIVRGKKIFLITAIFCLVILFLEFMPNRKVEGGTYFLSLSLVLFTFPVLVNRFEKMSLNFSEEAEKEFLHLEVVCKDMEKRIEDVEVTIRNLEKDNFTMLDLYEITKEMSGVLSFEDIFRFLQKTLRKNFSFEKGFLVILRHNFSALEIDKIYEISSLFTDDLKESYLSRREHYKVLERIYRERGSFYLDKDDDDVKRRFGIEVDVPFAVSALHSGNTVIGFLLLEGLKKEDFSKFTIFSTQISLELRKVILYEEIEKMATTDSLTGLYVRREIIKSFEEELGRAKKHKMFLSFLMIDIDHFKNCNDQYGHLTGDYVLREIARILRTNLREIDLIGRYGGEELTVLLLNTAEEEAKIVAERIREAVGKYPFKAYGEKFNVTVSIGGTVFPKDGESVIQLVANADKALYFAKNHGRNCVIFYDEIK
ncbi:MAG: GGDEF domain-containing protein [Candidatus Omnitrophica bacterium]|nr:GGDEF domain-containing protein [Candidatus Omnitrophota bacterium]